VTVGVWAGDFTGKPMRNVSGITGAGPIFRDIIQLAAAARPAGPFAEPAGLVRAEICPLSGLKPGPRCTGVIREVFVQGSEPQAACNQAHEQTARGGGRGQAGIGARVPDSGLAVLTPADGDVFKLDPVLRGDFQSIRLRVVLAEGFRPEAVEWWVNGEKAGESGPPFLLSWKLRPGSFTIKARARNGAATVESRPVRITVLR
jgi:penicillin-binding protein 1C